MPKSKTTSRLASLVIATWVLLPSPGMGAQLTTPVLVQDFAPGVGTAEIDPQSLATAGDLLYFSGFDPEHGDEPWVSDGSAAGTRRLADLCPGPCSSYPAGFTQLGDKVLFGARGTSAVYAAAGDQVEEIASQMNEPIAFTRLGEVVFYATSGYVEEVVYRSDGTRAGTYPAADFCSTPPCSPPHPLAADTAAGLYFVKDRRLYRLPAEGQPFLVHPDFDVARGFTRLDAGRVVFEGCKFEPYDCRAWVSDGSTAGTFPVEMATGGQAAQRVDNLTAWRGRVYYSNQEFAWFSTDGTVAGTRPESFGSIFVRLLASTDDRLFYELRSEDASGYHYHLRSRAADGSELTLLTSVASFVLVGQLDDQIFVTYLRTSEAATALLAATDGTAAGTVELGAVVSAHSGVAFHQQLFFSAADAPGRALGLWHSNGQPAGTAELPVEAPAPVSSWPEPFRIGASLAVNARPPHDSSKVWRVNPVSLELELADPRPLRVIRAGKDLAIANLETDFFANTTAITEAAVVDLGDGPPYGHFADDGHFFYSTRSPYHDLWETDGSEAGTRLLFNLGDYNLCGPIARPCDQGYSDITPSGDKVYFLTRGSADTWDLNVHRRGSAEFREIRSAVPGFSPLVLPGGRVAFLAQDAADRPYEYWITDGSEAGTYRLFTFPDSSVQLAATVAGSRLFFVIHKNAEQDALWTSTFSPGSAELLAVALPATMTELVTAAGQVYFTGISANGQELGVSDGTTAGTRWLDLKSGGASSSPRNLFALADGRVVFAASGDAAGDELWISDGTLGGSSRLTDLAPGGAASSPDHFAEVGKRLFFQATDGSSGRELWALDLPTRVLPCPEGRICLQSGHFDIEVTAHTAEGDFVGKKAGGTADSAIFTFFSANNWEMLVKVLDGCGINQKFWVFAASATDVGFTLKVKNRDTGAEKVYTNPLGHPAVAITDTSAFSCL